MRDFLHRSAARVRSFLTASTALLVLGTALAAGGARGAESRHRAGKLAVIGNGADLLQPVDVRADGRRCSSAGSRKPAAASSSVTSAASRSRRASAGEFRHPRRLRRLLGVERPREPRLRIGALAHRPAQRLRQRADALGPATVVQRQQRLRRRGVRLPPASRRAPRPSAAGSRDRRGCGRRDRRPLPRSGCAEKSAQKACSVVMLARSRRMSCSRQRALPEAAISLRRSDSLARMSDAAARVKVTTSMRSMSAPPSRIRRSTRSTSTVVLPEPAAALSSRLPPRAPMARACSSVQRMTAKSPLFSQIQSVRLKRRREGACSGRARGRRRSRRGHTARTPGRDTRRPEPSGT